MYLTYKNCNPNVKVFNMSALLLNLKEVRFPHSSPVYFPSFLAHVV